MGGGALGMFLFASSAGKAQVHKIHPLFQVGAMPKGELDYSKKLQKAHDEDEDLDVSKLKKMRAVRRQSMKENLENGRGLSDAHGGQWYRDESYDTNKTEEVKADRR
jgi:hypothetical protein